MLTPSRQRISMTSDNKTTTFVFPHETLTKIEGKPTNATLHTLKQELYANAMANECSLGCGTRGYLGIIMPTNDYIQLQAAAAARTANTADNEEEDVGVLMQQFKRPTITANMTTEQKEQTKRALRDYVAMDNKLKGMIQDAVDRTFYNDLIDGELGIAVISAKELLAYLVQQYGKIRQQELRANREALNAPWDTSKPISVLWARIKECQRVSKLGTSPIDDEEAMYSILLVLEGTGLHNNDVASWKRMYPLQSMWTLDKFKDFFNHTEEDRIEKLTVKDVGLTANAATIGTTQKQAATTTTTTTDSNTGKQIYYCWSHGISHNEKHTSATCRSRKEGHQAEATLTNTMGGSTTFNFGNNRRNRNKNNTNASTNSGNTTSTTATTTTTTSDN